MDDKSGLCSSRKKKKKKEKKREKPEQRKKPRNQRPLVMNNKTVCLELQSAYDIEINNELITMHLTVCSDVFNVPCGGPSSLQHHGNERRMKNSTLLITTCDNWASARSAQHKCIALLRKHKLCGNHRLGSSCCVRNEKLGGPHSVF